MVTSVLLVLFHLAYRMYVYDLRLRIIWVILHYSCIPCVYGLFKVLNLDTEFKTPMVGVKLSCCTIRALDLLL